ncbi:MAG: MFS transporter [Deltaproteobacteria bacterium]|nr:MFS transporter [Deltaproteobacteria bacterium]
MSRATPSVAGRPDPAVRRRALRWSIVDGVFHALMLGACESYLGALAVELGFRDVALSLLATVPILVGSLAQLGTPRLVRWLGGEKRVVVLGASLQALAHLGFLAIALTGFRSLGVLLAVKVVYWTSNAAIAPAWNAWMARLVPGPLRATFFARRNLLTHAGLLFAFLSAGFFLELEQLGSTLRGFAILHVVALVARAVSAFALARQHGFHSPPRPPARLGAVVRAGRWRVALYMAALLFGAQLAIPFFTPYMLDELGLDLSEYALLSSASLLAKGLAFPLWRKARGVLSPLASLAVAGVGVALVPLVWLVATDIPTLVAAQVLGGIAWAGYDLTSLELLMGDAPEEAPVEFFALASSLAGLTQVAGSLLGGWALVDGAIYRDVFLYSAIGRGAALVFLVRLALVRDQLRRVPLAIRFLSARPTTGAIAQPAVHEEPAE